MFRIRRARTEDADTLYKLAKLVYFINLPADTRIILSKIRHSQTCFLKAAGAGEPGDAGRRTIDNGLVGLGSAITESDLFMFVLEDVESGAVIGTSQLIARMGGPGNPTVAFKLSRREFFSKSLQTGETHMAVRLHLDESGPTEIGGLVLLPSYRHHRRRLGRLLSLSRFHFLGLHRGLFADRVIAEMMAPMSGDGHNLFWESLGRRFINLTYVEADRFCQVSREFMTALLPREEIYLTLLPPEARAQVGQVGAETAPARRMLEQIGFKHHDLVDPFDGGPYLEAATDDITIVRATRRAQLGESVAASKCRLRGYVSVLDEDGEFRAIETDYAEADGRVRLSQADMAALGAAPDAEIGVTRLSDAAGSSGTTPTRTREPARAPKRTVRRKIAP